MTSLLEQTLPPDRLELLFVDDGSTDGTETLLDELAAKHSHVRVIHQEASGWSGKPRNTGIDNARGDYVYFVDHDDAVPPDALEALMATARRTGADVVVGKIVGVGRGAPVLLFVENQDDATFDNTPLMSGLTPHKLFRKAFLDEHGIRFPEGKRRLEDHPFVVASYFAAKRIAVVADHVCYLHLKPKGGNAAAVPIDPPGYYANVRDSIDIVEAHTQPGPERNRLLVRFLQGECLRRLSEPRVFRWDREYVESLVAEVRRLVQERFPDDLIDATPPTIRARTRAILAGDVDAVLDLAERARSVGTHLQLESIDAIDRGWRMQWSAWLEYDDGAPVALVAADGGVVVDERLIPPALQRAVDPSALVEQTYAPLVVRHRKTEVEWFLPSEVAVQMEPVSDEPGAAQRLVVHATSTLDPVTAAGGRPLNQGPWELNLRLMTLGLDRRADLGANRDPTVELPGPHLVAGPESMTATPRFEKSTDQLLVRVKTSGTQ